MNSPEHQRSSIFPRTLIRCLVLPLMLSACMYENVCFVGGTSIDTPGGPVAIERLSVGDVVYSFDMDTDSVVAATVTGAMVFQNRVAGTLTLSNGTTLEVTARHPFYADGQWIEAQDLDTGNQLFVLEDGVTSWVNFSQYVEGSNEQTVYNIEVAGHHNYFSEGVLVHNKSVVYEDDDQDNFFAHEDCDDSNPEVHPEADEICGDELDNNCNNAIDEDCE